MFTAADLKNAAGMFPNLQAKKVFNEPDFSSTANCAYWVHDAPGSPVSIAFDSQNHMVVGNDGYYDQAFDSQRELKQLWFYSDPLNKQTPDASIKLYMGTPGEITFDAQDNLIIQDGTWNRIQMINLCTDPQWLEYLPGSSPVSTCGFIINPTQSPAATPASTPAPTSPSPALPTPSPSSTPVTALDPIAPTIGVTYPVNKSQVNRNTVITITASASDNVGIKQVDFYVNNVKICSDISPQYSCVWNIPNKPKTNYTIFAKAIDTSGNTGTSTSIMVSSIR
jgi:hypothetical protein